MPINIFSSVPVDLSDLHDVSIVNPQSDQYLRYNSGISKWQNSFLNTDVYNFISSSVTGADGVTLTNLSGPQTVTIGLATVNSTVGTFGSVSEIPVITVDPQGRITSVTTAISNFVVGTTTIYNTSYGDNSLINIVENIPPGSGIYNTAIGNAALTSNMSGIGNTALGYQSLSGTTGSNNTGIGYNAGSLITTGNNNVVIGSSLGGSISASDNHIIISDGSGNERILVDNTGKVTITGVLMLSADPTVPLEAATKQYVDTVAAGINIHAACETSTTPASNLSAATYSNGSLGFGATLTATANVELGTIGGYSGLTATSRVLVKDQASTIENGIYVVTSLGVNGVSPWILTRASDFDGTPTTEIQAGDSTYIQEGTLVGTQWVEIAIGTGAPDDHIVIGTDPIVFSQFAGAGTYTAGTGIDISSNVISNTGVLSLIAGANISISGTTGNVTISTTGTVPSSTTSSNLAGGAPGSVPYQSAASTTSMLAAGTTSEVLISGTTPSWTNTPTLTGTNFTGIPNGALLNSSVTIGSTSVSLGATTTTLTGLTSVSATTFIGAISGNSTTATTAVNLDGGAAGSVPYQSAPGTTSMLAAGTSTQVLVGGLTPLWTNSPTLTGTNFTGITNFGLVNSSLSVNGVTISLGGSGTVAAAAGTLTGTTLAANVVSSSLTSVGTLASLTVSGTATASSFNATSTKRVKKSVKNLGKEYLNKFKYLKPREYDRKDYNAHEFGFIAEEMALVYPEIVGKDATGKPSGIDYGKLSTILTAKLQDQQMLIETLQAQMAVIMTKLKV